MSVPPRVMALLDPARPETCIAIVGASNDRRKYGNIILHDLAEKGFTVIPVNPGETAVGPRPAYPDVASVPGAVHIVSFVVPPEVSLRVLDGLDPSRTPVVWFQPGSFDAEVLRAARARFAEVIAGDCIMVVTH